MHGVAVEEVGDVPRARVAPLFPFRGGVAQVRGEGPEPGFLERGADHLQERPHRPLCHPGIGLFLYARPGSERGRDQGAREREVDVRANPVTTAGSGTERVRQLLGQPALDTPRGDRYELLDHRVRGGDLEQFTQHCHEEVGPL